MGLTLRGTFFVLGLMAISMIQAGQSCEDFGDLCVNGAFCKTDGQAKKCTCGTVYTDTSGDCVAAATYPGAQCTRGAYACITNTDCPDGRCACHVGYALVEGGTCVIQAGKSCATPNGDKCVSHAECSAGTCTCSNGYTSNSAGLCDANIGTKCDTSVRCIASSVCDNVFGKCLIQAGKSCATPNGDKCVSHAECSAGTCACSNGYTSNSAGLCVLQNNGGAAGVSMWLLVYMLVTGLCLTVFVV